MMTVRIAGEGRYAHVEREQRWVASEIPPQARHPIAIVDVYLTGTRLRLRRMQAGEDVVLKLAQKVRPQPQSPELVKLTNMYLTQREYDTIARLGGAELRKTRWRMLVEGRRGAVDRFEGRLEGLVLVEVELDPDEPRLPRPAFAGADVTDDDRFSGGYLAHAAADEVERLLREAATPATHPLTRVMRNDKREAPRHRHDALVRPIRPIIVLGPERSGTFLLAEMVHMWGAYAGEPSELPAGDSLNPHGRWEYRPLWDLLALVGEFASGVS